MRLTDEKKPKKRNQKITVIILSLLGLCLLTAGISVISNQFLPKASETPDKLSQKDLAHAEEALHLMAELGEQTWHGLSGNIPLLLWNDDYAFLTKSLVQHI